MEANPPGGWVTLNCSNETHHRSWARPPASSPSTRHRAGFIVNTQSAKKVAHPKAMLRHQG
eukprot:2232311-Amphidinium_carterae.1